MRCYSLANDKILTLICGLREVTTGIIVNIQGLPFSHYLLDKYLHRHNIDLLNDRTVLIQWLF